ncbi:hypothetical protein OH77DRAFT_1302732 [Trametes cingulata]|nr:hypothetical protein OH77DRAFT_1302732 [Trametes cingulata]
MLNRMILTWKAEVRHHVRSHELPRYRDTDSAPASTGGTRSSTSHERLGPLHIACRVHEGPHSPPFDPRSLQADSGCSLLLRLTLADEQIEARHPSNPSPSPPRCSPSLEGVAAVTAGVEAVTGVVDSRLVPQCAPRWWTRRQPTSAHSVQLVSSRTRGMQTRQPGAELKACHPLRLATARRRNLRRRPCHPITCTETARPIPSPAQLRARPGTVHAWLYRRLLLR